VKEETGLSGGALAGIAVCIAVGFAVAMYCICKHLFSGEEEAGKASAGDVEAGSNDTERRKVLEKRLAYVRNQMPEEQKPPLRRHKGPESRQTTLSRIPPALPQPRRDGGAQRRLEPPPRRRQTDSGPSEGPPPTSRQRSAGVRP
jgi:hypothetical protein